MMAPVLVETRNQYGLAIDGGAPVRADPVPQWPCYSTDEIEAVVSSLRSGKVNQWTGSEIDAFQEQFAALHGDYHPLAVASGTLALEIILRALGISPGDEVIVPARSFVASASCVSLAGARPVFADVDLETQLITADEIARHVTSRTRAVLPVHLNGRPCNMPAIMHLAKRANLLVIEDCAQSLGGRIGGRLLGSFGDAAAFSFCQDKIVSTGGEGGMILIADKEAWKRAWSYRDHGKNFDKVFVREHQPGYRWVHDTMGTNARMTEPQAAIGRVQLAKIDGWIARRNFIASRLAQALSVYSSISVPKVPAGHTHARYRLEFNVDVSRLRPGWTRNRVMLALNAEGIIVNVGACPEIYREVAHVNRQRYPDLPNAQQLGESSLVMLTHPTIDESYMVDCEAAIAKVMSVASL